MKNSQAKKHAVDLAADLDKLHDRVWPSRSRYNDALSQLLRSRGFEPVLLRTDDQTHGGDSAWNEPQLDESPVKDCSDSDVSSRDEKASAKKGESTEQNVIALVADLNHIFDSEWSTEDFCVAIEEAFVKRGIDPNSLAGDESVCFRRVSATWWIKLNPELGKWQAIETSMSLSSEAIRALTPAQALARISADLDIIASRKFANKEEFMAACREGLKQYGGDKIPTDFMMEFDRSNEKHWDDVLNDQ